MIIKEPCERLGLTELPGSTSARVMKIGYDGAAQPVVWMDEPLMDDRHPKAVRVMAAFTGEDAPRLDLDRGLDKWVYLDTIVGPDGIVSHVYVNEWHHRDHRGPTGA